MPESRGGDRSTKILYIEDDPQNRLLARAVLEADGYTVIDAEDGLSGIEAAIRETPALILLDINLPGVEGYEVVGILKSFPKLANTPVIALTAYAMEGDRQRTLVAGCDGYIQKPIDVDAFPRQIREFLHGKRERVEEREEGHYLRELNQRLVYRLLSQVEELRRVNEHFIRRAGQLEELHRSVQGVTSELGVTALLEKMLPALATALGSRSLAVELADPPGTRVAATGERPEKKKSVLAGSGRETGSGWAEVEWRQPLALQGRNLGTLIARHVVPPGAKSDEEQLLKIVANQVAIAVENARLYEGLKRQMRELRQTQAQLVQSAKLAAIGELAANIAHEINNPLTAVLGFASYLAERVGEGQPMREELDLIQEEAARARDIVRDLLDFSRQREFAVEPADLNLVLQQTIGMVRRQGRLDNVSVHEMYARDLPLAEIDIARMKQVFLNIVNNAVYAMSSGGSLTVRTSATDGTIQVEFTDTGSGISPENLSRIFDPFFTTKPAVSGTGLGLSVSLGIVQSHGGTIEVRSHPGKGTTFAIKLPALPAPAESRPGATGGSSQTDRPRIQ
jgi:signal transduction histidine kinase